MSGLVTLPGNGGKVIMAIFVRGPQAVRGSQRVIADIARALYDYYLFGAGAQ